MTQKFVAGWPIDINGLIVTTGSVNEVVGTMPPDFVPVDDTGRVALTVKGTLVVPDKYFFPSDAARDAYFALHPTEIKEELYISTAGRLEVYSAFTTPVWTDISALVRGAAGKDGTDIKVQYSATGTGGWGPTFVPATHFFWRWSVDNGLTWSQSSRFAVSQMEGGLPNPYYFKVEDGRLVVRRVEFGADTLVMKIGGVEGDSLRYSKPMGGLRFVHPDGSEYFNVRQSITGSGKAAVFGNYDSPDGNILASSTPEGIVEVLQTQTAVSQSNITYTISTNPTTGNPRLITDVITAAADGSWRTLTLNTSDLNGIKYNTYIMNKDLNTTYSDHQNRDEYEAGYGQAKYTFTNNPAGMNTLPLSQSFPISAGTQYRIVYDFDKVMTASGTATLAGLKLMRGRVLSYAKHTAAERLALVDVWEGRIVFQTDLPRPRFYQYSAANGWEAIGKIYGEEAVAALSALAKVDQLPLKAIKESASINIGQYRGTFSNTAIVSDFKPSVKGDSWLCTQDVLLGSTLYAVGDMLQCTLEVAPTDIMNTVLFDARFVRIPASVSVSSTIGRPLIPTGIVVDNGASLLAASAQHTHRSPQNNCWIWNSLERYISGDIIKGDGGTKGLLDVRYIANGDMPPNTPFVIGTTGMTWKIHKATVAVEDNIGALTGVVGNFGFISGVGAGTGFYFEVP